MCPWVVFLSYFYILRPQIIGNLWDIPAYTFHFKCLIGPSFTPHFWEIFPTPRLLQLMVFILLDFTVVFSVFANIPKFELLSFLGLDFVLPPQLLLCFYIISFTTFQVLYVILPFLSHMYLYLNSSLALSFVCIH